MNKNISFEEWEEKLSKTPGFQEVAEELEPGYQVARLRIQRGLTQKQLAELVGTKQSGIARLESGISEPSLSFLRRVVQALDGHLKVQIIADETQDGISISNWPVPIISPIDLPSRIHEEKGDYEVSGEREKDDAVS